MIILNYLPDIKTGRENMLALLFDMNKLWEEYIYRMLKRCETPQIKNSEQKSKYFWKHKTIRPDIVVEYKTHGATQTFIIDTKWKIIETNEPSDGDLKQMFVYNHYWDADKSLLIYPRNADQKEVEGAFASYSNNSKITGCQLVFADVLIGGKLHLGIGKEILTKIGYNT